MVGSSPHHETKQWESDSGPGLTARNEPPWNTFRKYYDCDLAGPVAVCVRSSGDRGVWAVRQYPIEGQVYKTALRDLASQPGVLTNTAADGTQLAINIC